MHAGLWYVSVFASGHVYQRTAARVFIVSIGQV